MPHITLQYSKNLPSINSHKFFTEIHELVSSSLDTKLSGCRSRIIPLESYYIGNGDCNNSFVHLEIQVKSGREPEPINKLGTHVLEILKKYFIEPSAIIAPQISLEIREIGAYYFALK